MKPLSTMFRLAKNASIRSTYHKHKVGAVIVKGKKLISSGNNSSKTHPLMQSVSPVKTLHAEVAAIINADEEKLNGSEIYVYRQTKNGVPAYCRPCKDCQKILRRFGIRRMNYTTSYNKAPGAELVYEDLL